MYIHPTARQAAEMQREQNKSINKLPYCILNHLYEKHKEGYIGHYRINEFVKTINFTEIEISLALNNLRDSNFIILDKNIMWGSVIQNIKYDYNNFFVYTTITDQGIKYFENKKKLSNHWILKAIVIALLGILGWLAQEYIRDRQILNKSQNSTLERNK